MNDPVQQEVEDIAEKTRVVPVTMIVAVLVTLTLLSTFVFSVYEDAEEGSLHDAEGVVNEQTLEALETVSPID